MNTHSLANDLSLDEKIGQLLYIGLTGTAVGEEERALLDEVKPGGIIIFGRNVESALQLRTLLDDVTARLKIPPLLGIDQEGGLVDRLRRISTPMPAARAIRQHGDLAGARALGRITGEILRLLGFNMNFAPVMSIMTEDRDLLSNGLYSRSFGRSPGEVLGYTMVYLRGLQGAGCLGCTKHFPGIGAGEIDSHLEMPIIHLTHDDLIAVDLAPYIELFQREDSIVHAVMVSHGGFPSINIRQGVAGGTVVPASLNYDVVTRLLREELAFDGLVVTDDLEMGAVARHHEIEDAAVGAILAGEDMLLICARPDLIKRAHIALKGAVQNGTISEERLNASVNRVAKLRSLTQPPLPFDLARLHKLSDEVVELNSKLKYTYGGNQ